MKITGQMSIIGQVKLKKLNQANVWRAEICSILLILDLPDREPDLDQGVYSLVIDLRDLTDIVLPGEEEELIIAQMLLPSHLLTLGLIIDIIREDISLDLLLDLHHYLLILQEET